MHIPEIWIKKSGPQTVSLHLGSIYANLHTRISYEENVVLKCAFTLCNTFHLKLRLFTYFTERFCFHMHLINSVPNELQSMQDTNIPQMCYKWRSVNVKSNNDKTEIVPVSGPETQREILFNPLMLFS